MKKTVLILSTLLAILPLAAIRATAQSADVLADKLVEKGILTADEAKQLKAESAKASAASIDNALSAKMGTPDWITGYKLSGDFRGRFDDIISDNKNLVDRDRLRYRLRVGLTVNMKDDLQAGFRLMSGDAPAATGFGGAPLSGNSTMQDNGTKKFIYIDQAYGKWSPINNDTWLVTGTFGKMDEPFLLSPMVFDQDLTPEGGALQATYKINDRHSLAFNGAAFALDEESGSTRDPFLLGAQVLWNAKWTPKLASSVGIAYFDITSKENLLSSGSTNNTVTYVNQGNTRTGTAGMVLAHFYNPFVVSGNVTYTLDKFPLYKGAFPIKLAGEFMENPAVTKENSGYWGGITFGKAVKKGSWDISYRYQVLEADAWYDQLVDDDNLGYYQAAAFTGQKAGVFGGTNVKGHLIKVNYAVTDALTLSLTCYLNNLINPSPANSQSDVTRVMADVMWKF
ncbi:MAG TPA: putative porin [Candidatus Acidoferrales bacterium]|jgi:hypothetical protein|nr:putative porin [Candidatus Acidoferrales bacterium]